MAVMDIDLDNLLLSPELKPPNVIYKKNT